MRVFDRGAGGSGRRPSDRIVTVPNALSLARLAVLPWLWADLVAGRLGRAILLLVVFSATDWLDGFLARRLDQVTRLGVLLDPLSDRVFLVVVGVGFVVGGITPWWAVALVLVRDVVVLTAAAVEVLRGSAPAAASRTGKAATFGVMTAFAGFLLAAWLGGGADDPQPVVRAAAWVVFVPATAAYYLAAYGYARWMWGGTPDGATS